MYNLRCTIDNDFSVFRILFCTKCVGQTRFSHFGNPHSSRFFLTGHFERSEKSSVNFLLLFIVTARFGTKGAPIGRRWIWLNNYRFAEISNSH